MFVFLFCFFFCISILWKWKTNKNARESRFHIRAGSLSHTVVRKSKWRLCKTKKKYVNEDGECGLNFVIFLWDKIGIRKKVFFTGNYLREESGVAFNETGIRKLFIYYYFLFREQRKAILSMTIWRICISDFTITYKKPIMFRSVKPWPSSGEE